MNVCAKGLVLLWDLSYAIQLLRLKEASSDSPNAFTERWRSSQGKKCVAQGTKGLAFSDQLSPQCTLGHCGKSIRGKIVHALLLSCLSSLFMS